MATKPKLGAVQAQPFSFVGEVDPAGYEGAARFYDASVDEPATTPADDRGEFSKGFGRSFAEIPGMLAGVGAYLLGADDTRDRLIRYGQMRQQQVQDEYGSDAASFSNVLDGKASGWDFAKNAAGYATGQALQLIATGGLAGLGAKMLVREAAVKAGELAAAKALQVGATREAAAEAAKVASKVVADKAGKLGAVIGAGGQNMAMELGSIYPDAVAKARKEGRELDAQDLWRVGLSSIVAAGVDTAADVVLAGRVLGGTKGASLLSRAAREVPLGMAREGATEAVQTGIEHYGAGVPVADAAGMRDIIDSAAVGMVGGGPGGGVASLHRQDETTPQPTPERLPERGPLTRAANAGIDSGAIAPAPQAPDDATGQTLRDFANRRAAEIQAKAKGTPDETFTTPDGQEVTVQGEKPQFLTPEEKDELAFLKQHGGDATQLAQRYGAPVEKGAVQPETAPAVAPVSGEQAAEPVEAPISDAPVAEPSMPAAQPETAQAVELPEEPAPFNDAFAQREADRPPEPTGAVLPGDVLSPGGAPFKHMAGAMRAQKAHGPNYEIVRVADGLVVRRKESADERVPDGPGAELAGGGGAVAVQPEPSLGVAGPSAAGLAAVQPGVDPGAERAAADGVGAAGQAAALTPKAPAGEPAAPKVTVYPTSRAASTARRELGNTHKVQRVKGGFILRPMTDKETAAAHAAGKRAITRGTKVDPTKDSLLVALAKLGGLNRESAARDAGVHPDYFKTRSRVFGRPIFPAKGGLNAEDATQALIEHGYLLPGQQLRDLEGKVDAELGGTEQFSLSHEYGIEPEPLADHAPDELDASGYTQASPDEQAASEALLADLKRAGIDAEALQEHAATATEGLSADEYHAEFQRLARQALGRHAVAQDGGTAAPPDARAARAGDADRSQFDGEQDQQEDHQGLTLQAQTQDDLRARDEQRAAADKAHADEQKRLADKAKADAEVGEFTLTGSNSPRDVAAAAGQGDIFDAAPESTVQPAKPPAEDADKSRLVDGVDQYHYVDGNRGMTTSGSFSKDASRWVTFGREDVQRMGDTIKPHGATRAGVFLPAERAAERGKSAQQTERPEELIALRKRAAVLQSLLECLS